MTLCRKKGYLCFGAIEFLAHIHKIQPKKKQLVLTADRQHLYLHSNTCMTLSLAIRGIWIPRRRPAPNDTLGQLVGDALEINPNACRQNHLLGTGWLTDGDFLLGVDELLGSGDAAASPAASPATPAKSEKRTRNKTPDQLKRQAKQQKGRRVQMQTALDTAVTEVATLQGLLRDSQKSLQHTRALGVEREASGQTQSWWA